MGRKIVSDYRASLSEVTLSIVLYGDCTSEDGQSRENVRLYCRGLSVAASKHLHSESDRIVTCISPILSPSPPPPHLQLVTAIRLGNEIKNDPYYMEPTTQEMNPLVAVRDIRRDEEDDDSDSHESD